MNEYQKRLLIPGKFREGGGNPYPEETPPVSQKPVGHGKPPPKPQPPPLVDQFGEPIGEPTPEWKISLICWGLAILTGACVVMVGLLL